MKYTSLFRKMLVAVVMLMTANAAFSQLNIGTIPKGDSIVIRHDVKVNAVLPPSITHIANQWTIKGSNFSNFVTDDPDTGTPLDSTFTPAQAIIPGTGLNFDGVDDYVTINNTLGNFGTGDFTIDMQIRTTVAHTYFFSKRGTCGDDNFISMAEIGGKLVFELDENGSGLNYLILTGTITLNDNVWHHITATRKSGTVRIYVDGVLDGTGVSNANINNAYTLTLGKSICNGLPNGSVMFQGDMDEVRIWNRELCSAELTNNQTCEISGLPARLIAYYKLNNGNVGEDNNSFPNANVAVDETGNNNGTLINFGLTGATSNWVQGIVSGTCPAFVPPAGTVAPVSQTSCSGSAISTIVMSGSATTYPWTRDNVATVTGIAASGTGNISGTLTNTTNAPITVTFTITPTNGTCVGTPITATVTVNPSPDVSQPANQVVCNNGSTTAVNFSGSVAGTTFNWTNNAAFIGLAANGSGNIASFTATNGSNAPATATVTVTPSTGGGFAYITNQGSNTVSVINTVTNTVVGSPIAVGSGPRGVAVSADGSRVYVTNTGSNTVSVISTATNTVTGPLILVGTGPNGIAVSPDGSRAYVANVNSNTVSVINTAAFSVVASPTVGSGPTGIAVSPDGSQVCVTNVSGNNVSVINTATNTVVGTIPVGIQPTSVAYSPASGLAYVVNFGSNNVYVINTVTNSLVAVVPVGLFPRGVSVSPDGSRVYVANNGNNNVTVINALTNTVVGSPISVGSNPYGVSVSPDGSRLYVANQSANNVWVINTATNLPIGSAITVGTNPFAFGNFVTGSTICSGTPKTFTITVNPTPNALAIPASQTKCSGIAITTIALTGNVAGTIYNWTRDNNVTVTGIAANGAGDISGTLTNTTNAPITVTFTITPSFTNAGVTCTGTPITATVLVNPTNTITLTSAAGTDNQTVLINTPITNITYATTGATSVSVTGLPAGVTFSFASNTVTISGSPTVGPNTYNYNVTLNGGCGTIFATGTINVIVCSINRTSAAGTDAQTVCSGAAITNITYATTGATNATVTGLPPGVSGNWAANVVTISGNAGGSGTYTYTVTPTGGGCSGAVTATGTITVNANAWTGATSTNWFTAGNWTCGVPGTLSDVTIPSAPSNQPLITGGTAQVHNITIQAGATVTNNGTLNINGGGVVVNNGTYKGSGAWTGAVFNNNGGQVSPGNSPGCTSFGAGYTNGSGTENIEIAGTTPCTQYDQLQVTGTATLSGTLNVILFGGYVPSCGESYKIMTSTTLVGTFASTIFPALPAGLSWGITYNSPNPGDVTLNIIGTPTATATPSSQIICSGAPITTIVLNGSPIAGTVYNWTRDNLAAATGIAASGTGDISGSLTNATTSPVTVTFTITPTSGSCVGTPITATVTVNPTPDVAQPASQTVCNGASTAPVNFTGSVAGTTFSWTNNTPSVGLAASGTGNIASFTGTNATNAPVTATITVTPSTGAPGGFAYVANLGDNNVSVINTATNTVVALIPVGGSPFGASVSPDGTRAYTANFAGNVSVINTATNAVVTTVTTGSGTFGAAVTPDNTRVYVANASANNVSVINTASNTVIATVPIGSVPRGVAVSPDGTKVYVSYSATVAVINTATNTVSTTITVGSNPLGIVFSPDGTRAYVAIQGSNAVAVINTATNAVVTNIGAGPSTSGIVITPDGSKLYVTNFGGSSVTVMSTATNSVITTVSMPGTSPYGISILPDGSQVYIGIQNNGTVMRISTATNTVVGAPITVGSQPFSFGNFITAGGATCTGSPKTFTITINPTATVNAVANQIVCNGATQPAILFSSPTTGGSIVYNWTNNTPSIGLAASGSGDIAAFTATNATASPVVATITVTPAYTNNGVTCNGTPISFTITVNPTPTVTATPSSQTICSATPITTIVLSGNAVAGVVYNWTRDNNATVTGIAASGSGNISGTLTNTLNVPVTVTFTITPTANGCNGTPITATVLVNPTPNAVATPTSQTVCSGVPVTTIVITGAVAGTVFNWTRDNNATVTGIAASGSGNISGTLTNTTAAPVTVTFTITPTANGCPGAPITATVLVNPTATVIASPASQTICSANSITTIVLSGNAVAGVVYNWTRDNNATATGIAASGSGNISGTLTNTTNVPVTVTFTITPTANGCAGTPITATVTVNPTPDVNQPANQVVCNNTSTAPVNFTGTVAGTIFNWTNNTPSIGLAANGTGNIASFNATNATNVPVTATVTVTPSTSAGGFAYISNSSSNNVTVINTTTQAVVSTLTVGSNPYSLTANSVTSKVYVANLSSNNVSVIDAVTNSVVSTIPGINGPYGLATTPDGSKLYVSSFSVGNIVTVINTATNAVLTTVAVGSNPVGIVPTPGGTNMYVANSGSNNVSVINTATNTVSATIPVGGQPRGIAISPDGLKVYVFNFLGSSVSVISTASNTVTATIPVVAGGGYGIAVSTDGSRVYVAGINAVTVINTATNTVLTSVPVGTSPYGLSTSPDGNWVYAANFSSNNVSVISTATNTVSATIPAGSNPAALGAFITGGATCAGTPKSFTITVNPTPNAVATPSSQTRCSGVAIQTIVLTGNVAGTVFNWTRDNGTLVGGPVSGIAASGAGDISGTLTNTVNIPITVTFTITPSYTNAGVTCTGTPITATVLVNPTPNAVATPSSQTICNNLAITTIVINGNVAGTVFNWTRDNTVAVTGIAASGSGNISGTLNNTTNAPVTVTFTITPTANGCAGTPITATVTVNPTPTATATPSSQTICSANPITTIVLSGSPVAGTVYNWTRDNVATVTGIAASGSGNISGTLTNTTNIPITVTFTITPAANGCNGPSITATVLVNPTPTATAIPSTQTICTGSTTQQIVFTGTVAGTTYAWTRDNNATVTGLPASGSGNVPAATLTNLTNAPVTVTFTITPTANGCSGPPITATIVVNPIPNAVATPSSQTICSGSAITTIALTGNVVGTVYNWTRDNVATVTGIAASGTGNIAGSLTNTTFAPITVTFTITPSFTNAGVTCTGPSITATVTVNPIPNAVATPASQTVCNNTAISTIVFTGNVAGTVYNWTRDNTILATGIPASGAGNIAGTLSIGAIPLPITVTFTITPTYTNAGVTCSGPTITATVTIEPTPTVNPVASQVLCSGSNTAPVNFSGSIPGTIFNWTNNNTSIGLAASGAGNIASFVATNVTNAPVIATVTVTPLIYTNNAVTLGGGSKVGLSAAPTIPVGNSPYTIEAWVKPSLVNGADGVIGWGNYGTTNQVNAFRFNGPTQMINYWWANDLTVNIPNVLDGNWHHVVATFDGTTRAIYFDGVLRGSDNPVGHNVTTASNTVIGQTCPTCGFGEYFTGSIDEVRVWNVGKTQAQIVASMNAIVPASSPNLAAYYRFDEGTGTTTADLTGHGNNGIFISNPAWLVPSTAPITGYGSASCTGTPITFTYTVNPVPNAVATPSSQTVCSGVPITTIVITGNVAGTVFTWTRDNTVNVTGIPANGVGNISGTLTNNTNTAQTVTFTITPSFTNGGVTCTGPSITATVLVNPTPHAVATPSAQTVCSGTPIIPIVLTSDVAGTTYTWTRDNTVNVTGIAASGSGSPISGTLTNNTAVPQLVTFTITPTANGCSGPTITATVLVNPTPSANQQPNQVVCNGAATAPIHFTGPVPGTIYNWTNNHPEIGLAPAGTGDIASFIATNNTNAPLVATITVTPVANGCPGPTMTFTITVNPTPVVNQPANQVVCNNTPTAAVIFTSPTTGGTIVYNWTHTGAQIGQGPDGVGNIPSFTAINNTGAPVVATFTVIATYTNGGVSCVGQPVSFTITVNPTPVANQVANQTVCNNTATAAITFTGNAPGTVYNWTNSAPSIGLAASGTGNIPSFTATNVTGAPVVATIVVTPSYTNAGVTCTGPTMTFTITVNPTPTVNAVASQVVCNGAPTTAVVFTGNAAGTVYNWTNNNTSIGLAASGTGNIASFTAINNGTTAVVATITVTPTYTGNGTTCTGTPITFTITVNPTPTVNAVASQTVCKGATTAAINFTGAIAGTVFNWTNNNTAIGLAASGTGNIAAFTAANPTSSPITATITVTPTANGCAGTPITFTITVNPTPAVNAVANQTLCAGASTIAVNFTSLTAGTTFAWTNNTPSIGLAASGTGNIASFVAVNAGTTPVTATITVTPSANGCTGAPITFTITVNPKANVAPVANQTLCNGSPTTAITFTGTVAGTIFNWTNSNTAIGLAATGQGNIPSFTATNNTAAPITATITVTPTTGSACAGTAISFTITVNPTPTVNAIASQALCEGGTTTAINFSGATSGTVFTWTNNNTLIGLPASGTGNISPFVVTNGTGSTIVATITVTGAANGCTSAVRTFTITVFAGVNNIVITNAPQQVCLTDTLITLAATPAGGTWSGRGVSGNTFNAAAAGVGTTTLVYTLGNGTCLGSASVNVTVRDCIERHNVFANAIHIYPNPNGGQFNIRYLSDVYHAFGVRIIDADGHLIHTYSFANLVYGSVIPFDLRSLPSGTYFLEVFNDFEKAAFRVVIMK